VMLGFVLPIVLQSVITVPIGWLGVHQGWDMTAMQIVLFTSTSAMGFILLTRRYSAKDRVLTAAGYFPLMFLVFYVEQILVLVNVPGRHGAF